MRLRNEKIVEKSVLQQQFLVFPSVPPGVRVSSDMADNIRMFSHEIEAKVKSTPATRPPSQKPRHIDMAFGGPSPASGPLPTANGPSSMGHMGNGSAVGSTSPAFPSQQQQQQPITLGQQPPQAQAPAANGALAPAQTPVFGENAAPKSPVHNAFGGPQQPGSPSASSGAPPPGAGRPAPQAPVAVANPFGGPPPASTPFGGGPQAPAPQHPGTPQAPQGMGNPFGGAAPAPPAGYGAAPTPFGAPAPPYAPPNVGGIMADPSSWGAVPPPPVLSPGGMRMAPAAYAMPAEIDTNLDGDGSGQPSKSSQTSKRSYGNGPGSHGGSPVHAATQPNDQWRPSAAQATNDSISKKSGSSQGSRNSAGNIFNPNMFGGGHPAVPRIMGMDPTSADYIAPPPPRTPSLPGTPSSTAGNNFLSSLMDDEGAGGFFGQPDPPASGKPVIQFGVAVGPPPVAPKKRDSVGEGSKGGNIEDLFG